MSDIEIADDWMPRDADLDRVDAEYAFTRDVAREAHQLRVRDAARRKVAAERTGDQARPPAVVSLVDFLAVEDSDATYRVDGLLPSGGRVVLAAQWKAGKTTVIGNLLRSLVDGDDFLDAFRVTPAAQVVLLDDELDERTLRRWLRDQGIVNERAVRLVALRGRVASFNILDPQTRAEWAADLAGADVVIVDCLRPLLDALGLDESREAGRFLVAFDALLHEVGSDQAAEAVVVHHMGHVGERSRGDSRILDWPDASWKLVREDTEEPGSPRYLSAFGRDVDVPEGRLEYDVATRHLSYRGGSRRDTAADALWPDLVAVLDGNREGLSARQIEAALRDRGCAQTEARQVLKRAVTERRVKTSPGPRRAILHTLAESVRGSAWGVRDALENECVSASIERRTHSLTQPTQCVDHALTLDEPSDADPTPRDSLDALIDAAPGVDCCFHGVPAGDQPDAFTNGRSRCPQCALEATP